MDEEDIQDEDDLNVLLGLEGVKEPGDDKGFISPEFTANSNMQIILLSTLACVIVIGVAVIAVVYVMRKKRKYSRERMNEDPTDIEPPPYQAHKINYLPTSFRRTGGTSLHRCPTKLTCSPLQLPVIF